MEEKRIKITKTQLVDGEISTTESIGTATSLTDDMTMLKFQSVDEAFIITLGKDEATVKTSGAGGQAHIVLQLHQLTEGGFDEGHHHVTFQFLLKTLYHSGFNIFLDYDISLHGDKLAENALRTEVI
ncbi:MAG: hypothetical protein NTV44_01245 [Firmicutes bacterium]|nr:hypothetical protein [Bacillota bacterium]